MRTYALLILSAALFMAIQVDAQSCSYWKKCLTDKKAYKHCSGKYSAALAALEDDHIISVVDENTGLPRYLKKIECQTTGSMRYVPVVYSSTDKKFIEKHCMMFDCTNGVRRQGACLAKSGQVSTKIKPQQIRT